MKNVYNELSSSQYHHFLIIFDVFFNRLDWLLRLIHLNIQEFDKTSYKMRLKNLSDIREIQLSQIFSTKFDEEPNENTRKFTRVRTDSPKPGCFSRFSHGKTGKYEDFYRGFRFLREAMKTKMNDFRREIQNNRIFSETKKNSFSLCYPPGNKVNRTKKTQINVITMVSLEEYENSRPSKQFLLNNIRNLRAKSSNY